MTHLFYDDIESLRMSQKRNKERVFILKREKWLDSDLIPKLLTHGSYFNHSKINLTGKESTDKKKNLLLFIKQVEFMILNSISFLFIC